MKTGEWSRGQGKEKGKGLEGRKEKGKGQGGIRGRMGKEAFFQTKIYHILYTTDVVVYSCLIMGFSIQIQLLKFLKQGN